MIGSVVAEPTPGSDDAEYVEACLGRRPESRWEVAARRPDGRPSVIRNEPFLGDGTPMPTRYWLIDPDLLRRIGTIESNGGVLIEEFTKPLQFDSKPGLRYRIYQPGCGGA